ncbi:MAG: Fic family protein [Deltaproteobacteria bacterium]|nr:Fic family protein [Deltaproteobacteria bacterium]
MSKDFKNRLGHLLSLSLGGEYYHSYIPPVLPPNPPLDLEGLYPLLDQANTALGCLDGMSQILPDASLFIYMYIRKEAVLSSQIEGTQSSLSSLLLFENQESPGVPMDDVQEVSCYVSALYYGLERLHDLPLSLRLIKELHAKLMASGRGALKDPGEFRRSQNWIGGSRPGNAVFVPPPPEKLMECLGDLEDFLYNKQIKLPALVKAALFHVQFESIHPFLDGNGRLGRLLITFILCVEGLLKEPLLYLSLYFKTNRQAYYAHLQAVRKEGAWESWIAFFLKGVVETARQATETAKTVLELFKKDRLMIEQSKSSTASVLAIYHYFQKAPLSNTKKIKEACQLSLPTVLRSLNTLEKLGILKEISGKERHKLYAYSLYLDILNQGTELGVIKDDFLGLKKS